jgi:hypothetical protein
MEKGAELSNGESLDYDLAFAPQDDYLLILNMGDGTGVFHRRKIIFSGRPAFIIKNWIDQRFMKNFQVSGERSEPLESVQN